MDIQIITIFVLCEELLQVSKPKNLLCKVSDAEIMTTAV